MESLLQIGKPAPVFSLKGLAPDGTFKTYALTDYQGKWLVLFFYPLDFTFICPTEITAFSTRYDELLAKQADVLGASTDSCWSHKAWCDTKLGALRYPLLADSTRALSAAYQVLIPEEGHTLRGTFIIDPEGILRYALMHDNHVGRSIDETLRVLQALQTGELCPVNWKPGDQTLGKA